MQSTNDHAAKCKQYRAIKTCNSAPERCGWVPHKKCLPLPASEENQKPPVAMENEQPSARKSLCKKHKTIKACNDSSDDCHWVPRLKCQPGKLVLSNSKHKSEHKKQASPPKQKVKSKKPGRKQKVTSLKVTSLNSLPDGVLSGIIGSIKDPEALAQLKATSKYFDSAICDELRPTLFVTIKKVLQDIWTLDTSPDNVQLYIYAGDFWIYVNMKRTDPTEYYSIKVQHAKKPIVTKTAKSKQAILKALSSKWNTPVTVAPLHSATSFKELFAMIELQTKTAIKSNFVHVGFYGDYSKNINLYKMVSRDTAKLARYVLNYEYKPEHHDNWMAVQEEDKKVKPFEKGLDNEIQADKVRRAARMKQLGC